MSVLAAPAPARAPAHSADPGPTGRRRRRRGTLLVVAAFVLAVVLVAVLGQRRSGRTADDDPENPGPNGAQAVARVLEQQGVDVTVVRSADALDRTLVDADTTVVVTSTGQLGASTASRLLQHTAAGHLVLVDPSYAALGALGVDDHPATVDAPRLTADCPGSFGGVLDGLILQADAASSFAGPGCFTADAGDAGDRGGGRQVVVQSDRLVVFGAGQALTDDQVLRADNAAVALRLLGHDPRLVWYVPTYADLVAGDGVSVRSLLPDWLAPGAALATVSFLALMLWRARRLGPLVTEPLPVVVRAVETTRSLGRLYRRSGDRAHAAAVLRTATRARLTDHLGLGAGDDEHAVVAATARHLAREGRGPGELAELLTSRGSVPRTDTDLVTLATALTELEGEVRSR